MNVTVTDRRVLACLAACNGIPTDVLEAGGIERLLKAASGAAAVLTQPDKAPEREVLAAGLRLNAALAKFEGTDRD